MESDPAAPESAAFRQLEQLVRNLGDELASFRKRAHAAESRVKTLEAAAVEGIDAPGVERLRALEIENTDLRNRVEFAAARTRQLAARVKFVRQQGDRTPGNGSPG